MSGGPYTPLPSDCSAWSNRDKRCSRGISPCPCPLMDQLSYMAAIKAGSLRDWLDRVVELARAEGQFEPDSLERADEIAASAARTARERGATPAERVAIYEAEIDRMMEAATPP